MVALGRFPQLPKRVTSLGCGLSVHHDLGAGQAELCLPTQVAVAWGVALTHREFLWARAVVPGS